MTVEILAHFEDMVEQLMIAKGYDKPWQVVEEAIGAMYAKLPKKEKMQALERMVQAGLDSGPCEQTVDEVFAEIFAELDAEDQLQNAQLAPRDLNHAA